MLDEVIRLYEAYLNEFRCLEKNRKPLGGAFGFGTGPQDHPCHDKFVQNLEQLLQDFAAQSPASQQIRQVLDYIYFTAPVRWKSEPAVDWMLLAVHGLTLELIPLLDTSDAQALSSAYQAAYPSHQRLPVQKKLLTMLRDQ